MNATVTDPRQIEREADRTRAALAETLDALQHKLSPGELLDRGLGYMREHGGEFAGNLGNDIKGNPLPTLLVGIGLAWMMANGRRPAAGGRYQSDTEPVTRGEHAAAGGKAQRAGRAEGMKQAAHSAAESVRDRTRTVEDLATERYAQARAGFSHILEDQPLMLGGLAFALGAAAGAVAPGSRKEEEALHKLRGNGDDAITRSERGSGTGQPRVTQTPAIPADAPGATARTHPVEAGGAPGRTRDAGVEREGVIDPGRPRDTRVEREGVVDPDRSRDSRV